MKVILLKDIAKVGKRFEIKDVKDGYAINLLIPKGEAVYATKEALKKYGTIKATVEGSKQVEKDLIVKNLKGLDNVTLTISEKANEKGHLFAGLHKKEIAKEVGKQTKLEIDPEFIMLEHPIKEVGSHEVKVEALGERIKFNLVVNAA